MIKFKINEKGRLVVDPLFLTILPLKQLYERDKSLSKETALRELTYVFHMGNDKGPYADMAIQEREVYLKKQYFKDTEPDELVKEAVYELFVTSITAEDRVIFNLRKKVDQLNSWIEKENDMTDDKVRNAVMKTTESIDKMFEAIEKIQKRRDNDKKVASKVRGNKKLSFMEQTQLTKKTGEQEAES